MTPCDKLMEEMADILGLRAALWLIEQDEFLNWGILPVPEGAD